MYTRLFFVLVYFIVSNLSASPPPIGGDYSKVIPGIDNLFSHENIEKLKGKKIGLVTNQTGVTLSMESSISRFKSKAKEGGYTLVALFAPEHGLKGDNYADNHFENSRDPSGIPVYSLFGATKRPNDTMLKGLDLIVYDIQDIGSRSYTYISTLFYVMEEAAKRKIGVMVLDRPNPINGLTVDGPMLDPTLRSMVGYINVPFCHGMTIGELAGFFNVEYKVGCKLEVIPMKGWKRWMSFKDTGLPWVPTSPYIPEPDTPFYYATTGILGELKLVNIGIGYTLPFKLTGAPWINAVAFSDKLNAQKFPGVRFQPFYWKPFYGRYAHENCQGVLIVVTDPRVYKPVSTQYLLLGMLKSLYPEQFEKAIQTLHKETFAKVNGTDEVFEMLQQKKPIVWPLRELHMEERQNFMKLRQKYLFPSYS